MFIDDEYVATLDYAQMAPRILYGLAGASPPEGDAYTLPGFERHREGVKKVFNAMLNSGKPLLRFPEGVREKFARRTSVSEVIAKIREKHAPIAELLTQNLGLHIMFKESQILVAVLLRLVERRIIALPVHDALIIPRSEKAVVRDIMCPS